MYLYEETKIFSLENETKSTPQGGSPKKKNQNSKDSVRFHNYLFKLLETVFNLLKSFALIFPYQGLLWTCLGTKTARRPIASLLCTPPWQFLNTALLHYVVKCFVSAIQNVDDFPINSILDLMTGLHQKTRIAVGMLPRPYIYRSENISPQGSAFFSFMQQVYVTIKKIR